MELEVDYNLELTRTVTATRSRLVEAQSMEVDITSAVKTFNKVGEAASNMDYNRAFELLNKCNDAIDIAMDQRIFKLISDCYIQIKQFQ